VWGWWLSLRAQVKDIAEILVDQLVDQTADSKVGQLAQEVH